MNHSYIYFVVLGAKLQIPTGSNLKPTRRMFPIITVGKEFIKGSFIAFEAGSDHIKDFQSIFILFFCQGKRLEILSKKTNIGRFLK
jgi:hypothetical protein